MSARWCWDWPAQIGGDVRLTLGGRRIRAAVYAGAAPGSHRGVWRTRRGALRGWNLRIGRRRSVTTFVHLYPWQAGA